MKWRGRKVLDTFYSISTKFNHIFPAFTQTKIKRKRYCMFQFSPPCISQVFSIVGFEIHVPKDSRKIISHSSGTWYFKDFLIWAFANNNALYVEDGCFCSIQCKTYKNRVKMQVWSIDIKISSQQQKILCWILPNPR